MSNGTQHQLEDLFLFKDALFPIQLQNIDWILLDKMGLL
ncbi:hypothetical protein SPPR111872_04930 [Sphingobacterium prati]